MSDSAANLALGWKTCGMEPFAAAGREEKESQAQAVVSALQSEPLDKDCSTSLERARSRPARCVGNLGSDLPTKAHPGTASRDGWEATKSGIGSAAPACSAGITRPLACCRAGLSSSAKQGLGLAPGEICLGGGPGDRGEKSPCSAPKPGGTFVWGG